MKLTSKDMRTMLTRVQSFLIGAGVMLGMLLAGATITRSVILIFLLALFFWLGSRGVEE